MIFFAATSLPFSGPAGNRPGGLPGSIREAAQERRTRRAVARRPSALPRLVASRRRETCAGNRARSRSSRGAGGSPPISALSRRWREFWFAPAPSRALGMARALFFGGLLVLSLHRDFRPWSDVSSAFWRPIALFPSIPSPRPAGICDRDRSDRLARLSGVGGDRPVLSLQRRRVVGDRRLSAGTAEQLRQGPARGRARPARDAGPRVEPLGRRVLGRPPAAPARACAASGEYRWPIVLNCTLLSLVFFGAGVSKLRIGGAAWFTTDNLSYVFLRHQYP